MTSTCFKLSFLAANSAAKSTGLLEEEDLEVWATFGGGGGGGGGAGGGGTPFPLLATTLIFGSDDVTFSTFGGFSGFGGFGLGE